MIGHADIQMYALGPWIKHSLKNNNSSKKGQSLVYGLFLGASYKLAQQFGHIWTEERRGHKGEADTGVETKRNQKKVRLLLHRTTKHIYASVAVNTSSGN